MLDPFWVAGARDNMGSATAAWNHGVADRRRRPNKAQPGLSPLPQPFSSLDQSDTGEVCLITGRGASHGRKCSQHKLNHTEDMKMEYLHDC
jgi:hypothetical protein